MIFNMQQNLLSMLLIFIMIYTILSTPIFDKLDMFSFENMHNILFEFPSQQALHTCIPQKG